MYACATIGRNDFSFFGKSSRLTIQRRAHHDPPDDYNTIPASQRRGVVKYSWRTRPGQALAPAATTAAAAGVSSFFPSFSGLHTGPGATVKIKDPELRIHDLHVLLARKGSQEM